MARIQALRSAGGNRLLLLVALAAGLVAAVLVIVALSDGGGDDGKAAAVADTQEVLVATQSISAGTEITEEMVELRSVPADLVISGSYSDSEIVVGEVASVALAQGEQLTTQKIGLPVPDKGLSGVVTRGMRAVSLEVREVTAVGGLLLPGDRVDIIATYRVDRNDLPEGGYILRTETILQNVEVLSVAQEAQEATARVSSEDVDETDVSYTSGEIPDDVEEQPGAGTVTVLLSPGDAQSLILKQEHAQTVALVGRAYGDDQVVETPATEVIIVENEGFFDQDLP